MNDYKQEIQDTRKGALGSSDGKMLSQIASIGHVPPTAYKRLAVAKGLIVNEEIPHTAAVQAGDNIEQAIFEHLTQKDERYQSNPLWISTKYSRHNVNLISHPDIVLVNEDKKTIFVYEVKTTKFPIEKTKSDYRAQLYIHNVLAKEKALELGRGWKVKLALVHYNTDGLDLAEGVEFDPDRLTIVPVQFKGAVFDLERAMNIVSEFLDDFNYYAESEVVQAEYLPESVSEQFVSIANALREIKERENKVAAFKDKLYSFLTQKGIKKVTCDEFSFSVVEPTVSISTDYKKLFAEEIEAKTPRIAKRLQEKYKKTTTRKGYVVIKVNDK